MSMYNYLIVGAGLYGAMCAFHARKKGKSVLIIDKRSHVGGNVYCERIEGINVHKYGAHIFHTSNKRAWEFVNSIVEFNNFINSPLANYKGRLYNLPFNMNTFYALWGCKTPQEAIKKIEEQRNLYKVTNPRNLEEQAISLVGEDIYNILIKGYTEKQWGRKATELPPFIIKRLPVRFTFNNNYFNDRYQGVPIGGYNPLISGLISNCEVRLNVDFFKNRSELENIADKIIFTGRIDEYYDYKFGKLAYRSLRFDEEILDIPNYQGNAVVNYTDADIPYTRIIEHKHFDFGNQSKTVITKEYPVEWTERTEPYYPVNDSENTAIYNKYKLLAEKEQNVIFGGRLAEYRYYDMNNIVEKLLDPEWI